MSLIPSESLNFPDGFRADVGWRLPKEPEPPPKSSRPRRAAQPKTAEPETASNGNNEPAPEKIMPPAPQMASPPSPPSPPPAPVPASTTAPPITPAPTPPPPPAPAPNPAPPVALAVEPTEPPPEPAPQIANTDVAPAPAFSVPAEVCAESLMTQLFALATANQTASEPVRPEMTPLPQTAVEQPTADEVVITEKPAPVLAEPVRPEAATAADEDMPEVAIIESVIPQLHDVSSEFTAESAAPSLPPPVEIQPVAETTPPPSPAQPNDILNALQKLAEQPTPVQPEFVAESLMAQPASVPVETPAQAHHILELIAAAVQRGALVGGPAPEPEPIRLEEPTAIQPVPSIPPAPVQPMAMEPAPEVIPTAISSPLPSETPPLNPPKMPAKIRITPRKIKPRAPTPAPTEPTGPELLPTGIEIENDAILTSADNPKKAPMYAGADETIMVPPERELPIPNLDRREMQTRKVAAAQRERAQSDSLFFSARQQRNRWIGFGLSEAAAVTSLILLGRFGFTHHFPDPTLKFLVFILVLAAAAIAVALPVVFLRNNPARWHG